MMNPNHILIADDHPMLLEGVASVVARNFPDARLHTAHNGKKAWELTQKVRPEIAVLDIEMPEMDGIDVARRIKDSGLNTRILFLTLHKERMFFDEIRALNVEGYVLKEFSVQEIVVGMRKVLAGKTYYGQGLEKYLDNPDDIPDFTKTQLHVLRLIAKGKTTKEIAEMLFVSPKTIETHRYNITKKLVLPPGANSLLKWVLKNSERLGG